MAQNTYTLSVHMGDGNINSGNITSNFNIYVYKSDEDAEIMRWLSPLEPNNRHQGVRADRFDGVGDSLLETKEFREWRSSESGADGAVLFCSGNPGVQDILEVSGGALCKKRMLLMARNTSSLAIDSLCDQEGKEESVVVGLYCDFHIQEEQTVTNIMGAILKQLVGGGDIPEYLREAFQAGKRNFGGRGLSYDSRI